MERNTVSARKRQKALACRRCRSRKQKVSVPDYSLESQKKPTKASVQEAGHVIIAQQRITNASQVILYTRALEERIVDLESQIPHKRPANISVSRKTTTQESPHQRSTETDHVSQVSLAPRPPYPRSIDQARASSDSVSLRSLAPCPSLALPSPYAVEGLPDPRGQCGHSSLLIGILATLTSTDSSGLSQTQPESSNAHTFSQLTDQVLQADRVPRLSTETSDRLVQIYLERVNPRYPFLHLTTFLGWYESWKAHSQMDRARDQQSLWKDYFVTMVHAVALLLTPRVSVDDIATSQSLYNTAMQYLAHVFAQPDPVLHAQAYLLLTLHALHSPSSHMIVTIVSAMMRYCVMAQLHLAESEPVAPNPAFSLGIQTRRRVFWSAYALDRFISWIYHIPNNIIDEHISVELFSNVGDADLHHDGSGDNPIQIETPSQKTHVSPALHLFRCRRIQSRIISTMMRSDFKEIDASTTWREHMLGELDSWRSQLRLLSDVASKSYTSDRWVGMAYNYTILLLHQPTKDNVCNGFGDRSVPACVQIAMTFRTFQKDRQTAQLWPGLLSQVAVGITLLYCFWATPPQHQTIAYRSREIPEALRACSTALAILAERWVQAEPLRDVFDVLAKEIPLYGTAEEDPPPRRISAESASYIQSLMPLLTSIIMHRGVLRMIREMITEDFPRSLSEAFHGQLPGSHDQTMLGSLSSHMCSEECPFFREPTHPGSVGDRDAQAFSSLENAIGSAYGIDDETLMFPLLFGSAEF
ncbi:hypothetical protein N7517_007076 [Penicillium concentricum]|uniref:Xylanolytic transcriptional activator regulatory domain-containing protein n=1 Tax=Penicillium concentricum TaxID=293559 RepID=A0A9W9VD24_9EURO|nr:uncharacterized protein N7517_007076 [Penicillium concentricum]KAJ5375070.1 hypothetical protein N7517_007076 [Penicillium concentricum]